MNNLPAFDDSQMLYLLASLSDEQLDELPFGVIGFNESCKVVRYNRTESEAATFPRETVLGQDVFVELAPCLNNYLVAGRFEDTSAAMETLDEVIPYVLTFRMAPTPVRLRMLSRPADPVRYMLVERSGGGA